MTSTSASTNPKTNLHTRKDPTSPSTPTSPLSLKYRSPSFLLSKSSKSSKTMSLLKSLFSKQNRSLKLKHSLKRSIQIIACHSNLKQNHKHSQSQQKNVNRSIAACPRKSQSLSMNSPYPVKYTTNLILKTPLVSQHPSKVFSPSMTKTTDPMSNALNFCSIN